MTPLLGLIALALAGYALMQMNAASQELRSLKERLDELEANLRRLHLKIVKGPTSTDVEPLDVPAPVVPPVEPPKPTVPKEIVLERFELPSTPPPPVKLPSKVWSPKLPAFDWEKYMGAKLLPRIAAVALFIGMAFGIKYSFDHNWVSPAVRVSAGFLI